MKRWLSNLILIRWMGWKIEGTFPNDPKYMIVVAPHTSNMDFVIGVFVRAVTGLKSNFIGKKQLFVFPFGYFFRWMGGYPVDRSKNSNAVDQVADLFKKLPRFVIAIAPEGTRKKTGHLKSGFYYIAKEANIPVLPVGLDYKNKKVVIHPLHHVADTFEAEHAALLSFFSTITGKNPKNDLRDASEH